MLIVGASGFLGRALVKTAIQGGIDHVSSMRQVNGDSSDSVRLDLADPDQVMAAIDQSRPTWVVNAAAETGVDRCEADPERTRQIHVEGTRYLARACEETGAGLVSISTNYVFDGENGPYSEDDSTNPLNMYGRTKLESETVTLEAACQSVVVRTAVLYGYHEGSRPNFVTWAVESLSQGQPIRVVTDECTNPTQVDELASFLLGLCSGGFEGLIHFAGLDFLSRYAMVERICRVFDLDPGLVTPVESTALGQAARRPLQAGLQIERLKQVFGPNLKSFDAHLECLAATLKK